jgi:hypothetical protein
MVLALEASQKRNNEGGLAVMADKEKCAHGVCDCKVGADDKYCGEYCENAEKSGVLEIGCGCEHAGCR